MPNTQDQDIDITPDLNGSTTQPVQRNPTQEDVDITPHAEAAVASQEPGLGTKALGLAGKGLGYLGGLSRAGLAQTAPAQMMDMLQSYLRKKPMANRDGDFMRALGGNAPSGDEYLERAGLPKGKSPSEIFPDAYTSTPEEDTFWRLKPAKGGLLDPTPRGAAGTAIDILTDPLTHGAGGIGKAVGELPEAASEALARSADNATVRHLRPTPSVARALGPDKLREIGREVRDSGAMGSFQKADTTAANLSDLKNAAGKSIGEMIDASKATTNPYDLAAKFENEVIAPLRGNSKLDPIVASLEKEQQAFLNKYGLTKEEQEIISKLPPDLQEAVSKPLMAGKSMNARQVEELKRAWQDSINYLIDPKNKQLADMKAANLYRQEGEKLIPGQDFKDAKKTFGNLAAAEGMADRTAALTNGGTGLLGSLGDLGVNLEALAHLAHGSAAGVPMVAARHFTKGRMASTTANALGGLSNAAKAVAPLSSKVGRMGDKIIDATRPGIWSRILTQPNGETNQ